MPLDKVDKVAQSVNRIRAAARAKARLQADRELAASLRYALWLREGSEGPAPDCAPWLRLLAGALSKAYPEELAERARNLMGERLPLAAEACWQLVDEVVERTLH